MNEAQRDQVLSNARYLREVRLLDPAEICEYVEGRPRPAAVREVLRESAVALGLVERADGLFEPVADGPVRVAFDGVAAFPDRYARVLEDLLVDRYGPGWPRGDSGERIRARTRSLKADYLHGRSVAYDEETALCYALYHLPDYYAVVQYVLAELVADGLVPRDLRVLDVGAGVGGPALGVADFLPDDALVDYHAVEPSAAATVLDAVLAETGRNFHATIHGTTAEAFDFEALLDSRDAFDPRDSPDEGDRPAGGFDVVLFANVLRELADPAAVVERYADALASDGTVVATAPADRNAAVGLRDVERSVADEGPFDVYAPTVRLWPGASPSAECWSFDVRSDLEVPGFQRQLEAVADEGANGADSPDGSGSPDVAASGRDDAGGEFVNVDVQYAYSLLRLDGRRRYDVALDPSRVARFADSDDHVTNRVDCHAVKLSNDLSGGGNPLYLLGDGSQRQDHFAVLTRETSLNGDLSAAGYGELLSFENVLVLWNDDEEAYNLVVDDGTIVDRIPP